ncbi:DUF4197 domain-containing protein [Iodobacter fluviatilis]|uniref:Uncharacterized protein DUF4197 n=1 Tax=Iodobacter fluviatilis TaxID=537 RepID=A0A377SX59_9NEIS|nr:DUF4197 domain-containing protein [Iodobacter fluviatilis]TCU85656.1 uncharacterized protein DUF4197 [Iodobacter fluviatilis]STR44896.1 Uncharacterised protein [Iodobacter fluviatilis]
MKVNIRHSLFLGLLCIMTWPVFAGGFDLLSERDASGSLKEALIQGVSNATLQLSKTDGFLANDKVRIPLPDAMRQAEPLLRTLGLGQSLDELQTSMNRAAEAAVPRAKQLLINAVKKMSVQDAKNILLGADDAGTQYFKQASQAPLTEQFLPIVRQTTSKLQLAEQYNRLAGKAAGLGLLKAEDSTVEQYVTRKALDGLYQVIAEEERAIRQDPLAAAGKLAKKTFGLLSN